MATVNTNRATNQLMSGSYWMRAGLVAAGLLGARMVTDFARSNIVDIGVQGGDALYAFAGAGLTMAVLPRNLGMPLALGMSAAGVQTGAREFGLV
jgi:hypothetical protein